MCQRHKHEDNHSHKADHLHPHLNRKDHPHLNTPHHLHSQGHVPSQDNPHPDPIVQDDLRLKLHQIGMLYIVKFIEYIPLVPNPEPYQ